MQGVYCATLAASGQMRADIGTDTVPGVGSYVAVLARWMEAHAHCFPLSPHYTLSARCRLLRCPHRPSPLPYCCTSPFFRPPHVCSAYSPFLYSVAVWSRFLQFGALASLRKCASVQVCPFDALPSQIPLVGAPVGWSVAGWCYEFTFTFTFTTIVMIMCAVARTRYPLGHHWGITATQACPTSGITGV